MARSIRVSDEIYELVVRISLLSGRSLNQQVEYWVRLGARAEKSLTSSQVMALLSVDAGAFAEIAEQLDTVVDAGVDPSDALRIRHAKLEAQVLAGERRADSLVLIPQDMVDKAIVTFPRDAFGPPGQW